jgi:RND family efflux transporter MFP subunit
MNKAVAVAALVAAVFGGFALGGWYRSRSTAHAAPGASKAGPRILRYICPMHPQFTSDRPGTAPCCGMRLEPVYEDGSVGGAGSGAGVMPAGTLNVSPERQQLIGIRVSEVSRGAMKHLIRTSGRIAPDETRTYIVNASADGWIRDVHPVTTGDQVEKDQPLATFYTKDFLPAQQNYFYGIGNLDRLRKSGSQSPEQLSMTQVQVWAYEDVLEELGMDEIQRKEIAESRKFTRSIVMRSPGKGFILSRKVTAGQRFQRGDELYRVADLTRVWVLADVFQRESEFIRRGQTARITVPSDERVFQATVSEILPQFDADTRTLKVRLELDNSDFALRPDMFVDVEFPVDLPPAVTIPGDAIVDSGLRKTVYVDRGNGYFEPRSVETGWRFGGRAQVLHGLEPGERVVVAGNFLLDSESRMKAALTGADQHSHSAPEPHSSASTARTAVDPVCGMDVEIATARLKSEHKNKTYYFCNESCKREFDSAPDRFVKTAAGTSRVQVGL